MYAVIESGGKQHKVSPGETVQVERLAAPAGEPIEFSRVLMISDDKGVRVGTPVVDGAKVVATVLEEGRGEKIIVFKKIRRKQYRRTKGHRQYFTRVRIDRIEG
jgi:large subunit ribosomal protein L21